MINSGNRVALITGATDGIGKALAGKLLKEGWEVVIIGRTASRCEHTVNELRTSTGNNRISAIVADLSLLKETKRAGIEFLSNRKRLDFLCLNANAISNEHMITEEGFEMNFALGFLTRAMMINQLKPVLEDTPGSHILSVLGLNRVRIDFDDLSITKGFSGWKGLGRWQWAMDLWFREFNRRKNVPLNLYMPGLVKTKILANEPQPMRSVVKIMNMIMGISPEKSAKNIFSVMNDITSKNQRGVIYSYKKIKKLPKLNLVEGDAARLWNITETLLKGIT